MAYRIYFDEASAHWVLANDGPPLYLRRTVDQLKALVPPNETFAMSAEDEARLAALPAAQGV
jgi:hypothetical protein